MLFSSLFMSRIFIFKFMISYSNSSVSPTSYSCHCFSAPSLAGKHPTPLATFTLPKHLVGCTSETPTGSRPHLAVARLSSEASLERIGLLPAR